MKIKLLKDIVIPAGSVIETGPGKVEWNEVCFEKEVTLASKSLAFFTIGISDLNNAEGYFEIVEDNHG